MRHFALAALAFWATSAPAAPPQVPLREMNLDGPGALEAIGQSNPAHYAKIIAILRVSQMEPCEHVPMILKTRDDVSVENLRCESSLLLMSFPPKRHMTFVLDDVRYTSNVAQLRLPRPQARPVDSVERWFAKPLGGVVARDLP
jgi:hypothetical protein